MNLTKKFKVLYMEVETKRNFIFLQE